MRNFILCLIHTTSSGMSSGDALWGASSLNGWALKDFQYFMFWGWRAVQLSEPAFIKLKLEWMKTSKHFNFMLQRLIANERLLQSMIGNNSLALLVDKISHKQAFNARSVLFHSKQGFGTEYWDHSHVSISKQWQEVIVRMETWLGGLAAVFQALDF